MTPSPTAQDIAQDLLERTTAGYLENKFDLFAACFSIPHAFETFSGKHLIASRDDLRKVFDSVRAFYALNGITEIDRYVVAARFTSATAIESTHETRLLSGNRLVNASFPVMSQIHLTPHGWQISSGHYALADEDHDKAISVLNRKD